MPKPKEYIMGGSKYGWIILTGLSRPKIHRILIKHKSGKYYADNKLVEYRQAYAFRGLYEAADKLEELGSSYHIFIDDNISDLIISEHGEEFYQYMIGKLVFAVKIGL